KRDWSSDVCSSDLGHDGFVHLLRRHLAGVVSNVNGPGGIRKHFGLHTVWLSAFGSTQYTVVGHVTGQRDGIDVVFLDPCGEISAIKHAGVLLADALEFWFHLGFDVRVKCPADGSSCENWCALR